VRLDESPEMLLSMIEELAGTKLRSADDITTYSSVVEGCRASARRGEPPQFREGFR
jgi:hypothetical protein